MTASLPFHRKLPLWKVVSRILPGKGVNRPSIKDHLPICVCLPHLILKSQDLRRRHQGVVCAVKHEYFAFDVARILGIGGFETSMEGDEAGHLGPAPGKLEHNRAPKQ